MCGLIGVYTKNKLVSEDTLLKATFTLRHRGPDGYGIWINKQKTIGLGHTRLSVIGINNGAQPLKTNDESIVAVVNGELYDYQQIKNELISKNYTFSTNSDSEILLNLYQEYGTDFFHYLNGEFSFILWDANKNRLIAGRDRFGIKPLYYAFENSTLYIASEIKALIQLGVQSKWNTQGVLNYCYGIPFQPQTCFSNIYSVKSGHFIMAENHNIKLIKHRNPDFSLTETTISDEDYIKNFRSLFESAVNRRLESDASVGCYLSGGIDSAAILSIAAKTNPDIKAFTIVFNDNPLYNEYVYAEKISQHLRVNLFKFELTQDEIALNYERAIHHQEALIYQTNGIGKMLLSQFAQSNNIKSVLTGEGADEFLFGYPSFKEDYITQLGFPNATDVHYPELNLYKEKLGYIPAFLKLSCEISKFSNCILNDEIKNTALKQYNPFDQFLSQTNDAIFHISGYVNQTKYLWSESLFPELILSFLGDRMEMANSIEGRLPFLDKHLINFMNLLPTHLKINKKLIEKYILREALRDNLPDEIYVRKKHMYTSPPLCSFAPKESPVYKLMKSVFSSLEFKQSGFFNADKTLGLLAKLPLLSRKEATIAEFSLHIALSSYFLGLHYF